MSQYSWATCPQAVEAQVTLFRQQLETILGTNILGLYLHGSLAMGSFNPNSSDIDLLVVTAQSMTIETKRRIIELLLHMSMSPCPIEISLLIEQQIRPFRQPLPYDLHYSESWREHYRNDLANGQWITWNDAQKTDVDLAVHLSVVLHRGICLFGRPIKEVFPVVPSEDYIVSILEDFKEAQDKKTGMPVYFTLNACRIYAYLHDNTILSKDEGGTWALRVLPQEYHPLVKRALDIYRGNRQDGRFDETTLDGFAAYMAGRIYGLIPPTQPS